MGLLDWLVSMGATVPVIIIFLMGMGVFFLVLDIRKDTKANREKYHQLDKLSYGTAIAVQTWTGIQLINESVTGDGDHSLNRHIPTLKDKV